MPEGERPRQSRASTSREPVRATRVPLKSLFRVASIAGGIQFGWALQLSLLTPYVQELGIPHAWASIIWLCGPLSGLFVQPLVGLISDRCTSRFGRRRPFILGGAVSIMIAVLIIGFSADIGWLFGDRGKVKVRAIAAFVVGFWILDVANNVTQGPCRALLADLTKKDHRRTRVANAYFSLFMAAGNILGYATGSFSGWYKLFPFTLTDACAVNCANLKSAFLLDIIFITLSTYTSLSAVEEHPLDPQSQSEEPTEEEPFLWQLFGTFKFFPSTVWVILLVTTLTWTAWFPFTLFDTDWVGREIFRGDPTEESYSHGVRVGTLGLLLNSVVLGVTSLFMEKLCGKFGAGFAWGVSNVFLSLCFVAMLVIASIRGADDVDESRPSNGIVAAVMVVFAVLGAPLAVTYSVPYALISSHIEKLGLGQGLSMGVLNVAIVVPQMVVSVGSGPWDEMFGGGNSPAFVVAAVSAFAAGLVAILAIPRSGALKVKALLP